jgi:hypothetical protein
MTAIDGYLADLGARLRVDRRRRSMLLDEVREHLLDAAHQRMEAGQPGDRAEEAAVQAFGSSAVIARSFNAAAGARAMRRAPIIGFLAGGAVVTALLIVVLTQPRGSEQATPAMQVSFFLGLLAFQVAVVAGGRGASRAAALWRSSASCGADRAFVRRCTVASMVAAGIGALSVAASLVLAARQASPALALAAGAAAMVAAAAAGLLLTLRLDVNADDDDPAASGTRSPALLGLGETVIGFACRHPVASCVAAVVAGTTWAMRQAEAASVANALPWGIGEAIAVIAAFLLLGPMLQLRPSRRAIHHT